jgi:hypothetical protein
MSYRSFSDLLFTQATYVIDTTVVSFLITLAGTLKFYYNNILDLLHDNILSFGGNMIQRCFSHLKILTTNTGWSRSHATHIKIFIDGCKSMEFDN